MDKICFVIMPFGGRFDDLYKKIYVPTIRGLGMIPIRADEIYNNQSIHQDIMESIKNADIILADVSNKNPNVNYELGIAIGLEKEIVITTACEEDVPSDYRHIRYLKYDRNNPNWGERLSSGIQNTIQTIMKRIGASCESHVIDFDEHYNSECDEGDGTDNYLELVIKKAKEIGYDFQHDTHDPSHALLKTKDSIIMIDCIDDSVCDWHAATTCIIANKIETFSNTLPKGHILRMRNVLFENYGTESLYIDYLYDKDVVPMYTSNELSNLFDEDFNGVLFCSNIRFVQENFLHDRFYINNTLYYSKKELPNSSDDVVCFRDGYYISGISDIHINERANHSFYRLSGLLPIKMLNSNSYAEGESHWLADWNCVLPSVNRADIVKFKIKKIYPIDNHPHVLNSRNITFSDLQIIQHNII